MILLLMCQEVFSSAHDTIATDVSYTDVKKVPLFGNSLHTPMKAGFGEFALKALLGRVVQ